MLECTRRWMRVAHATSRAHLSRQRSRVVSSCWHGALSRGKQTQTAGCTKIFRTLAACRCAWLSLRMPPHLTPRICALHVAASFLRRALRAHCAVVSRYSQHRIHSGYAGRSNIALAGTLAPGLNISGLYPSFGLQNSSSDLEWLNRRICGDQEEARLPRASRLETLKRQELRWETALAGRQEATWSGH
jgi:hypothetical protein